jgi:hypothetical protein
MTAAVTSPAQPLMAAVRDAVTAAGVPFGDSRAPTREGSKPWIVAWADAGVWVPRTMTGSAWSTVLTCHCYGLTADSARIAARLLADALTSLAGQPVAGRLVRRPVQQAALAVSRNDADNPPTYDATVEWRLTLD